MTWSLFDGNRTKGKVMEATALYERAEVDLDDAGRRIELEVRTAYSNFIEADEVLKSQEKVVEEAEEALRLARARSEAGTGTQLDVLERADRSDRSAHHPDPGPARLFGRPRPPRTRHRHQHACAVAENRALEKGE